MRIMSQSPAVLMATLVLRGDPSLTINAEPSQLSMTAILSKLYNEQAIYSESHPSMVPDKCVAATDITGLKEVRKCVASGSKLHNVNYSEDN